MLVTMLVRRWNKPKSRKAVHKKRTLDNIQYNYRVISRTIRETCTDFVMKS